MTDKLFTDCCYGSDQQHGANQPCPQELAHRLTPNQHALLDDLCGCPGLFAGQYTSDGAGIEHLPSELWERRHSSPMTAMIGLSNAWPTDLGLAVYELGGAA